MLTHWTKRFFPKNYAIIVCILGGIVGVYNCKDSKTVSDYYTIEPIAVHENGNNFVGSTSCIPCHSKIYNTHKNTAHFRTSTLADSTTIKGSFELGKNTHILNDRVRFTMMASDSGFYQKANFIHNELELFNRKIDVVFGSGTKGQSYLRWENDQLFQLHTSYFTPAERWTRSPGLKELTSPRPVIARCVECHATYAKSTSSDRKGNHFDKSQIIYGIDCERCHGPSGKHVGYHQKNPDAKVAKYIVKYASLSRQQRLDACALCHSGGRRKSTKPPFTFLIGDDLNKFFTSEGIENHTHIDVHGNQFELLTRSACFKKSDMLECNTCHNPHENERGNLETFNHKCIGCHTQPKESCPKMEEEVVHTQANNCVSCHMPLFPSKTMVIQLDTVKTAVEVRTHLIDIYP